MVRTESGVRLSPVASSASLLRQLWDDEQIAVPRVVDKVLDALAVLIDHEEHRSERGRSADEVEEGERVGDGTRRLERGKRLRKATRSRRASVEDVVPREPRFDGSEEGQADRFASRRGEHAQVADGTDTGALAECVEPPGDRGGDGLQLADRV
jgi:hypothetical protein